MKFSANSNIMSYSTVAKKRVLVIGNGVAGSQFAAFAAKNKNYSVTVLTPFDYQEISLCMTKAVAVGGEEHTKCIYPLNREEGVEYVLDSCAALMNNSARTTSGRVIDFDVCIIATGQRIPVFYPNLEDTTKELRIKSVAKVSNDIKAANSILISGGGAVGSELAADIKIRNKGKKIILVTPQSTILPSMHQPFPELATQHVKEIGIEVIANDRVERYDNGQATLASGKVLSVELHISAHPTGGNCTFLPAAAQDAKGYAMVDDTFKVATFTNVFAIGDCSNYDKVKTYPRIDDQMPVLKFNVKAVLEGTPLKHHIRGASMFGQFTGPGLVALGHGHPDGWGVGPDMPGPCCSTFCWCCCFFGYPCAPPVGKGVAKFKADFNAGMKPKPGVGIHS